MFRYVLVGAVVVAVTVVIHAGGTIALLRFLKPHIGAIGKATGWFRTLRILIGTVLLLVAMHVIEILLWALVYLSLLPDGELQSAEDAVYFSFVTFTTLGYGDIVLSGPWRIVSGIEAMNGVLLAGWSTAMLFTVVQKTWQMGRESES